MDDLGVPLFLETPIFYKWNNNLLKNILKQHICSSKMTPFATKMIEKVLFQKKNIFCQLKTFPLFFPATKPKPTKPPKKIKSSGFPPNFWGSGPPSSIVSWWWFLQGAITWQQIGEARNLQGSQNGLLNQISFAPRESSQVTSQTSGPTTSTRRLGIDFFGVKKKKMPVSHSRWFFFVERYGFLMPIFVCSKPKTKHGVLFWFNLIDFAEGLASPWEDFVANFFQGTACEKLHRQWKPDSTRPDIPGHRSFDPIQTNDNGKTQSFEIEDVSPVTNRRFSSHPC